MARAGNAMAAKAKVQALARARSFLRVVMTDLLLSPRWSGAALACRVPGCEGFFFVLQQDRLDVEGIADADGHQDRSGDHYPHAWPIGNAQHGETLLGR